LEIHPNLFAVLSSIVDEPWAASESHQLSSHILRNIFQSRQSHDQILKLAKICAEMKRWIAVGEGNSHNLITSCIAFIA